MIMPLIPTQTDRQPPRPGRIPATASPAASSSPNNKKRKRERESQSQGGVKKRVVVIDPKEKSESARINTDDVKIKTKGIEGNALQKGKKQEKVQEKKLPSGPADYVPIETERSESRSQSQPQAQQPIPSTVSSSSAPAVNPAPPPLPPPLPLPKTTTLHPKLHTHNRLPPPRPTPSHPSHLSTTASLAQGSLQLATREGKGTENVIYVTRRSALGGLMKRCRTTLVDQG